MYYSASKHGFFENKNIDDAVEISTDCWHELLTGQSNGKIIAADENGYPILIDPPKPDFKDLQTAALTKIDTYHAQTLQTLVGNPTQAEKDTWSLKLEIATAIINGDKLSGSATTFLTASGKISDDDQKTWAATVLNKANKYAQAIGFAERLRSQAKAAVKAATTEDELNAALDEQRKIAEDVVAELQGGN